jgi:endonuclease/exonuclease/phosphatase (EEP) superfamily protein YafD
LSRTSNCLIRSRWPQAALFGLSAGLCLAAAFCYGLRPDWCAAVTVFPPWVWAAPGLLLVALGWRRSSKRFVAGVGALWLLYLTMFAEEPVSLLRWRTRPAAGLQIAGGRGQILRVVSLNCAGGTKEAAAEVVRYRPDVVLLQETPGQGDVEELTHRLFGNEGHCLVGPDASIIAHGSLSPAPLPPSLRGYFVQARVRLVSGIEAEVISLRLLPAVFRMGLWSPECWREQTANRRARREQLRAVARQIRALPAAVPLIVGGDLNAPAGDAVVRLLQPRLYDTFREGGIGWGDSFMNEFPVLRIDQIWASKEWLAMSVVARSTRNSDHRMVVCDLTRCSQ